MFKLHVSVEKYGIRDIVMNFKKKNLFKFLTNFKVVKMLVNITMKTNKKIEVCI